MKNPLAISILLGLAFSSILLGCETITCYTVGGSITTENIGIAGFKRVELYTSGNVFVTQGDSITAELEANDDMSKIVQYHYDLADSTMQIDVTEDCFDGVDLFQVNCLMMDINGFENNGSGLIHLMGPIDNGDIDLKLTASGGIQIDDMRTTGMTMNLGGSGSVIASGPDTCNTSNIQVSGSGSVFTFNMINRMADVNVSGSGNVEIHVTDTLTGSITGSGNISYRGNPHINVSLLGSGSLIDAN